jgi:hypothetical protein
LTSPTSPGRPVNNAEARRWRAICEHFEDIKARAYFHDLAATYRELDSVNPAAPGLLEKWEQLRSRLSELDRAELMPTTRSAGLSATTSNYEADDPWFEDEGETGEYVCPHDQCDRRIPSSSGLSHRCELFGTAMKPERTGRAS